MSVLSSYSKFCIPFTGLLAYISRRPEYKANLSAALLNKCFQCKLWENSIYVSRQLERIGPAFAGLLAAAGMTSFLSIREANPRHLERVSIQKINLNLLK